MTNNFDPCDHKLRQIAIMAAKEIRKAKGLPEEKNITKLLNEVSSLFGIPNENFSSRNLQRLPAPHEMKDDQGNFILPRKDCPKCGSKQSVLLRDLCRGCTEAEGGKYQSIWECPCGYKERNEKPISYYMSEEDPDWRGGMKKDLGILIRTDDGLK